MQEILSAVDAELFGVWFLIGAALVFWMQAGFAMVETGFTRAKNSGNIIMKNLMDFCIGTVMFVLIGFSFLLGEDLLGFIGKLNNMIRMTILTFEGKCAEKGISFDLVLTGKELFVRGDMTKIQQVLYNLIDNAIKFSTSNLSIKIETSIKNEKVFISVKDSGIGIPKDSLKKIWERFYKTDVSRGKDKRGSGLGLSIVKEIIQAHNENINVISTEGNWRNCLFCTFGR